MMRLSWLAAAFLAALFAMAGAGHAAATMRHASIAEGESFEFSPFAFELEFSEPVQLVGARLVDQEGKETPLDLTFYRSRSAGFVIELPVMLPHGYRLSWRARGGAGPDLQGSVGFVVKGCLDPRAASAGASAPATRIATAKR
jgi:methionine-rich copper-binding protein CopC